MGLRHQWSAGLSDEGIIAPDSKELTGFRLVFTEEIDGRTVLFGPSPIEFSRHKPEIIGMTVNIYRRRYRIVGARLREGGPTVARSEVVGLAVVEP